MELDEDIFDDILQAQREKEGRNPNRETYRKRVEQAYDFLIEKARQRETTYYGEVMDAIGTGRGYIGPILGGVSRHELEQGRPPLSALVLRKATDRPGHGFCENLLADYDLWEEGEDREAAWQREVQRVFDEWAE